jgi:hypothetical protein
MMIMMIMMMMKIGVDFPGIYTLQQIKAIGKLKPSV